MGMWRSTTWEFTVEIDPKQTLWDWTHRNVHGFKHQQREFYASWNINHWESNRQNSGCDTSSIGIWYDLIDNIRIYTYKVVPPR